jgi:hypothetical protein
MENQMKGINQDRQEEVKEEIAFYFQSGAIWKNKKNQNLYLILDNVINANNNTNGDLVIIYTDGKDKFCREMLEFQDKFLFISNLKELKNLVPIYNQYRESIKEIGDKSIHKHLSEFFEKIRKIGKDDIEDFLGSFSKSIQTMNQHFEEYNSTRNYSKEWVSLAELKHFEGGEDIINLLDWAGNTKIIENESKITSLENILNKISSSKLLEGKSEFADGDFPYNKDGKNDVEVLREILDFMKSFR